MKLMNEIPERFWSLFRSVNRACYIDALLRINEEYQYSNYFLSREVCIQLLGEYFSQKKYVLWQEDTEDDMDFLEPPATRVLNWLLKTGWLRRVEDYANMTVNIVIPDYAAVMLEAFSKLASEEEDEAQLYIQNVYAILFSLRNDPRANESLLNTAIVNTRRLNKSLQDMLHNMDKFFGSLLKQKNYGELLKDHLEGYVEEIVNRKYHMLKTSDNFYLYKTDIKSWITAMREDEPWMERMCARSKAGPEKRQTTPADIMEKLDLLERGFDDIEHRISNMDKEHTRYVRATVTRLNYLLNQEDNMKGLVIQLLNHFSKTGCREEELEAVAEKINLSQVTILSEKSLYKRRKTKADFKEQLKDEEAFTELTMDEVLNLNRVKNRYSRREIEDFIGGRMTEGKMAVTENTVSSDEEFEKLILAYDYSLRKKSIYQVEDPKPRLIKNGSYTYPGFVFTAKTPPAGSRPEPDFDKEENNGHDSIL